MIADDELIMLSALQHYLFCPRQCALIHIEGSWKENFLTASGRTLHEHVDKVGSETRRDIHIATSLRLVSHRMGVMGVADLVEFHRTERSCDDLGRRMAIRLPNRIGFWRPFPVEYKRGKPKSHRADEVQLCAQGMCLEEMLDVYVGGGALFYGEPRRRMDVLFDDELRGLTDATARGAHELLSSGVTPPPVRTEGCDACSLKEYCFGEAPSARRWIEKELGKVLGGGTQ